MARLEEKFFRYVAIEYFALNSKRKKKEKRLIYTRIVKLSSFRHTCSFCPAFVKGLKLEKKSLEYWIFGGEKY